MKVLFAVPFDEYDQMEVDRMGDESPMIADIPEVPEDGIYRD